jgi:C-terminal processing protease CtpA/Prc
VKIQFKPNRPVQSKIYLLTNKYTASACEPLVHGLKNTGNIQVIGEKTAGAMLSPTLYDVGNDFFLIVPTADYLTNEWTSIEGVGVKPDIEVKSKKALDFVLLHRH